MSVALMLQPASGFVATSSRAAASGRGLRLRREAVDSEGRYLPDGLTEEQWAEIRLKEIRERQSKDLGAWGPRFKKQKAPFWADKNLWGAVPSLPETAAAITPALANLLSVASCCVSLSVPASILIGWRIIHYSSTRTV